MISDYCADDLGIGRIDIVETRGIGLKSRGCYDVRQLKHLIAKLPLILKTFSNFSYSLQL